MSGSEHPEGCYAYCHTCDWYATPDDHEYADVVTDADQHATFTRGHTTTAGFSERVREKALTRKVQPGTEQGGSHE